DAIEAPYAASPEEISALALHYFEAQRPVEAWHYCRLAGDRAKAVAANVDAARLYERALLVARRLRSVNATERADVWMSLGAVRDLAGLKAGAFEALRQATVLLSDDPIAQARLYVRRALAQLHAASYVSGLRE